MVSKSILAALSIVALACHGVSSQNSPVSLNPCVGGLGYIDAALHLNLRVDLLISNVLGVVVNVVRAVLRSVGGIVAAVVGLVSGLVGGLLNGRPPVVAAPSNLGQLLGLCHVGTQVTDEALRKQLGAAIYKRNYLREIFIYCVRQACNNEGINMSGQHWTWAQQANGFNITVWIQELLAIRVRVNGRPLITLFAAIEQLLNVILGSVGNITGNVLGQVVTLVYSIVNGLAYQCGYDAWDESVQCVYDAYDRVLKNNNCGYIDWQVLNTGNWCYKCMA